MFRTGLFEIFVSGDIKQFISPNHTLILLDDYNWLQQKEKNRNSSKLLRTSLIKIFVSGYVN